MQMIRLDVKGKGVVQECTGNVLLYYNLEHWLRLTRDGAVTILKQNDILLVNSKTAHTVECTEGLYVRCEIDLPGFRALLPGKRIRFLCDSTVSQNGNDDLLRDQLKKLLRCYYQPDEFREIRIAQESYGLMSILASNYMISHVHLKDTSGAEQLADYIDRNYQESLTLNQVSAAFHMTPQYFSKYFKQTMGINYFRYLSKIRLEHAVEMLLSTDESILQIALFSGFPSGEAFGRVFQEAYQTTPQEFRQKEKKNRDLARTEEETAWKKAMSYLRLQPQPGETQDLTLEIDPAGGKPVDPIWSRLINLGSFGALRDSGIREQIGILQDAIHYEYARISPAVPAGEMQDSFFEEEQALDFLRTMKLKLWLAIPLRAEVPPERTELYLQRLISQLANRISIEGIREWRFELVCDQAMREKPAECWRLWERFSQLLKRYGCGELIGFGLPLGDAECIRQFYLSRPKDVPLPMQTFQAEPTLRLDTNEGMETFRSSDSSYLKNRILLLYQAIPDFQAGGVPLYITSWNNTTLRKNLLNDTSFRGAEILKDMIGTIGLVRAIAPRMPLDLMIPEAYQGKMLFGGDGLITRSGIRKPSFYSYAFLARNASDMVAWNANAIAFGNGRNYQVICHNTKRLNYRYYLEEQHLKLDSLGDYFDDQVPLRMRFHFRGIRDGEYIVKTRLVSQEEGNVQYLLHRMADRSDINLHPNDVRYLQQVSVPRLEIRKINVEGGTADVNIELPANAFAHIHVIYQY